MRLPVFLISITAFFLSSTPPLLAAEAASSCAYVTVRANFGAGTGSQGVGWVIRDRKTGRDYILTPAHVTRGAKTAIGGCHGKKSRLALVGSSATYDLALYSVDKGASFAPAISLPYSKRLPEILFHPINDGKSRNSGSITSYRVQSASINFPKPGNETDYIDISSGVERLESKLSPLAPHAWQIGLSSAIRPGMSGSPAFLYSAQSDANPMSAIPFGMTVKVVGNSNYSYAIPTESILLLLPKLMAGKDPWRLNSPLLPYLEFTTSGEAHVTTKAIVFPADGLKLTDACPQGVSSTPAGGNWADGGGNWADGGGNWADGGSTAAMSPQAFDHLNSGTQLNSKSVFQSYFKWSLSCKEVGLKLTDGSLITGLKPDLAVTSVEDSFAMFLHLARVEFSAGSKILKKYGVFSHDAKSVRSLFCNSRTLGGFGELWMGKGGLTVSNDLGASGKVIRVMKGFVKKSVGNINCRPLFD